MKNKRYSDAQIMGILKQAESGVPVSEMKAMAEENRRLKRMYAEMSMQNDLLKEALRKKHYGRLKGARWPLKLLPTKMSALHWPAGLSRSANAAIGISTGCAMRMRKLRSGL